MIVWRFAFDLWSLPRSPMSKLLIVIIDGFCAETLACARVPYLDELGRRGIFTSRLHVLHPSLTLPNAMSLFTSVPPEEHGILTNNGAVFPAPQTVSLLSLLRYRCRNVAAFYSSDRLRPLLPPGCLQTSVMMNAQSIRNVDRELAQLAAFHLQREKPDCCLLYLEGANITGTHFGFGSEPHLESVEQADRALMMIIEHLRFVGADDEYAVLVIGCRGGAPRAAVEPGRQNCAPLFLAGPGLVRNIVVEHPVSLLDMAPTMAAILDVAPHPDWQGRTRSEWFLEDAVETPVSATLTRLTRLAA